VGGPLGMVAGGILGGSFYYMAVGGEQARQNVAGVVGVTGELFKAVYVHYITGEP
jgi:hypothetical protein